nr:hypothetical protein Iba_chr09eCG3750 [Ipomoea batatas]
MVRCSVHRPILQHCQNGCSESWQTRNLVLRSQIPSPSSRPRTSTPLHNRPSWTSDIWFSILVLQTRLLFSLQMTLKELPTQFQPLLHCSAHPIPAPNDLPRQKSPNALAIANPGALSNGSQTLCTSGSSCNAKTRPLHRFILSASSATIDARKASLQKEPALSSVRSSFSGSTTSNFGFRLQQLAVDFPCFDSEDCRNDNNFNGNASLTLRATIWPCGPWPSKTPQNVTSSAMKSYKDTEEGQKQ